MKTLISKTFLFAAAVTVFSSVSMATQDACGSQSSADYVSTLMEPNQESDYCSTPCPYIEVLRCEYDPECPKDAEYYTKMALYANCMQLKAALCRPRNF